MSFPISVNYQIPHLFAGNEQTLTLNSGLTTFVGANGSGKTQVMRFLKDKNLLRNYTNGKQIKFLSAGRLSFLEEFRSNVTGNQQVPQYDNANFGGQYFTERRHLSETGYGVLHTLVKQIDVQIKVKTRLDAFFKRTLLIDWDAGNLTVKLARDNSSFYSSAREANGLMHLIVVLGALYDDQIKILLLDEPEISLHPQLQAFLLKEIQKVAGNPCDKGKKIIIMATHSTTMIDVRMPEDLTKIVFFSNANQSPHQISKEAGELKNKRLKDFISHINSTHKEAFFCSYPLLVEGQSDYIICNNLERHLDLYLSVSGTQIVPVMGKNTIPVVLKLMKLIGKNPIILADLDALTDDNDLINTLNTDDNVTEKVVKEGRINLAEWDKDIRNQISTMIQDYWEDIKDQAEQHSYWKNIDSNKGDENKMKKRVTVATLMTATDCEIQSWNHHQKWSALRKILTVFLDFLEKVDCFILRKGTIENYYQFSNQDISSGKPNAALEEIEQLITHDVSFIESHYADIIRALKRGTKTPIIDESSVIISEFLNPIAAAG